MAESLKRDLSRHLLHGDQPERFVYTSWLVDGSYEEGEPPRELSYDASDFQQYPPWLLKSLVQRSVFAIKQQGARPFLLSRPRFDPDQISHVVTMYGVRHD